MSQRIASILSNSGFSDECINTVLNAYSGKGRYYHNTQHILEMLDYADKLFK